MSVEKAGGFVGTIIGMFAQSGTNQPQKDFYVDFDWFKYENSGREWICK